VSATLSTIMQHRELHKQSSMHQGRLGPAKHRGHKTSVCHLPALPCS
jgi:hypothetical protein